MKRTLHKFAKDGRARINGIPVMNATVNQEGDGMLRISLVDWPAVESDFLTFHKNAKKEAAPAAQMYKVLDEEKRLIYGVVMRADFPIYRFDEQNGEYFIVFEKDTIRTLAEKYLAEGRQNNVNVMHLAGSDVEGVEMVQMFIKDTAAGISPAGFEVIEDGSLFAEFHVLNDDVWAACKSGEYRGFSIEVMTGLEPAPADFASQLNAILNNSNLTTMGKAKKLQAAAAALKFKSVNTDKGVLSWEGEEDAVVGTKVFVPGEGEDAEPVPAPDGDYTLDTGTVITVAGGAVEKIVTKDETEEPSREELAAQVKDLRSEVEELEGAIETLINQFKTMKADFAAFKKAPAGEPAHKRFTTAKTAGVKTGAARLTELLGK